MTFSDDVTILRATGQDAYGNPVADWTSPAETAAKAFVPGKREKAYFPAGTDLRHGDRLRYAGHVYDVLDPAPVRSPARTVLVSCGLRRVEG